MGSTRAGRGRARVSRRDVARALERVNRLGKLCPVEPVGYLPDGAPDRRVGEVYVMAFGTVYHLGWCETVGREWDRGSRLLVIERSGVGSRPCCRACTAELADPWSGSDMPF